MIEPDLYWFVCLHCWATWVLGEPEPCDCAGEVLAYRGLGHHGRSIQDVPVGDYL